MPPPACTTTLPVSLTRCDNGQHEMKRNERQHASNSDAVMGCRSRAPFRDHARQAAGCQRLLCRTVWHWLNMKLHCWLGYRLLTVHCDGTTVQGPAPPLCHRCMPPLHHTGTAAASQAAQHDSVHRQPLLRCQHLTLCGHALQRMRVGGCAGRGSWGPRVWDTRETAGHRGLAQRAQQVCVCVSSRQPIYGLASANTTLLCSGRKCKHHIALFR